MKYKGIEIGLPTLEQIEDCCREQKLHVPAIEVYHYYTKKNWLTGKHKPVKTLESACAAVNGAFLKRLHKNEPFTPLYDGMNNNISKNEAVAKAKNWVLTNMPCFLEAMELIRKECPQEWERLYSEFTKSSSI